MDIVKPLAFKLLEGGGEVRCYLEEDEHELRQEGCKVAVGLLTDDGTLEAALTNVHTFIPVLPDPAIIRDTGDLEMVREISAAAVFAARGAAVEQTIIPVPGLSASSELGRTFLDVRQSFLDKVDPVAVIVTGMLWGPQRPFTEVAGSLGQDFRIPVVAIEDLIAALSSADDREGLSGVWELGGEPYPVGSLDAGASSAGQAGALLNQALEAGMSVGSSAYEEFRIAKRSVLR
ncbi:MAG: hypothetical protein KY429_05945 [Actinobacteria bacterium]|nr:hypothetical protein [Actinomycetota bacterium]